MKESISKILPFGTVVSLKNSNKKLCIIGVNQIPVNSNKMYDYCACLHPYGYLNPEDIFLFNKEKIEKIYFYGYYDEQLKDFYEDLEWYKNKGDEK